MKSETGISGRHLKAETSDQKTPAWDGMGQFSCKECVDVLRAYLDGEMTPEEQAHLKAHLGDCPPCVDFLEQYKATPGLCKKALAAKMPEELSFKLKAFLREKTKPA